MPNGTYGGVRGRKTKVGRKLLRFPPTRSCPDLALGGLPARLFFRCFYLLLGLCLSVFLGGEGEKDQPPSKSGQPVWVISTRFS